MNHLITALIEFEIPDLSTGKDSVESRLRIEAFHLN